MQFYYDGQVRRYIAQFIRLLSNVGYKASNDVITGVPVRYAETSRQASQILRNNSANSVLTAPAIACYITDLAYNRDRVQEPNHISKIHVRERAIDEDTNTYTTGQGQGFTIERHMPVPFDLSVNADIWTTSTDQKLQILEQLLVWFNPSFEIQTNSNFVDWTSLSLVELTNITYSSRSIPGGTDDTYDVATLSFNIPIWLSPPVKLKKLGVIQTIFANIYDESGMFNDDIVSGVLMSRQYITPTNFGLLLLDGKAKLIAPSDTISGANNTLDVTNKGGTVLDWDRLVNLYGELKDGISLLRLTTEEGNDIIGTVTRDENNSDTLLFDVDPDTIPTNTLSAINAIINPLTKGPGHGLPAATNGQRYLLVDDIGNSSNSQSASAWGNLVAHTNDIVEYNGSAWIVSFDSENVSSQAYVTNGFTNIQYKWTGSSWVKSYEGTWAAGTWTLVL